MVYEISRKNQSVDYVAADRQPTGLRSGSVGSGTISQYNARVPSSVLADVDRVIAQPDYNGIEDARRIAAGIILNERNYQYRQR